MKHRELLQLADDEHREPITPKVGTILIAKDPCEMEDDGESSLTVGWEYEVECVTDKYIEVIDDQDELHSFTIKGSGDDSWNTYFIIKQ